MYLISTSFIISVLPLPEVPRWDIPASMSACTWSPIIFSISRNECWADLELTTKAGAHVLLLNCTWSTDWRNFIIHAAGKTLCISVFLSRIHPCPHLLLFREPHLTDKAVSGGYRDPEFSLFIHLHSLSLLHWQNIPFHQVENLDKAFENRVLLNCLVLHMEIFFKCLCM